MSSPARRDQRRGKGIQGLTAFCVGTWIPFPRTRCELVLAGDDMLGIPAECSSQQSNFIDQFRNIVSHRSNEILIGTCCTRQVEIRTCGLDETVAA